MNAKFWLISLLTVASISSFCLPARSKEKESRTNINTTTTTIQQDGQTIIITGDKNKVRQYSTQTNVNHTTLRGNGKQRRLVQNSNQTIDIMGDKNHVIQTSEQTSAESNQ